MRKYLGNANYKHAIIKIEASVQFVQKVTNIDSLLKTMNLVFTVTNKKNQNIHFMNERFDRWVTLDSNQFSCILTANCNHFEIDPQGSISTFIENNGNSALKVTMFKISISQSNNHLYSLVNDF